MSIFRRRQRPPFVQVVFDYIDAHDDWFTSGHTAERNGGEFEVWIANGTFACAPYIGGYDQPWPRKYRAELFRRTMDALARSMRKRIEAQSPAPGAAERKG